MDLYKIIKYIAYALGIIGTVFALLIITGSGAMIDNILYITYVVLFVVIALVLIYVLKGLFAGDVKKTLMTVGAFLVILIISYAISSGSDLDLVPFNNKGLDITESTSKMVGAGLYAFYALAIIAIGAMAISGVKKITNK